MRSLLAISFTATLLGTALHGQPRTSDVAGSRDHPLLARYPGSVIEQYLEKDFDEYGLVIGPVPSFNAREAKRKVVSGKTTRIHYLAPPERSAVEVFRNYEEALTRGGAEVLFSCRDAACGRGLAHAVLTDTFSSKITLMGYHDQNQKYLAARLGRDGREVYVAVFTVAAYSVGGSYRNRVLTQLDLVETAPMKLGLVTLNREALATALEQEGRVAIYGIYFDTDRAEVKPESNPQLDELAKLLERDRNLKLLVVGHTDNQGTLGYNQQLSERRARAVVEALVARGISRERLTPLGVGMAAPVASNKTEEGRQRNRRVELVAF